MNRKIVLFVFTACLLSLYSCSSSHEAASAKAGEPAKAQSTEARASNAEARPAPAEMTTNKIKYDR